MNRGKIFIISGPSGVGKGTIAETVIKKPSNNLYWAKSYTTRPERESDKSEGHYIFVDENKFRQLEKEGEILESNYFNGNWYGSSKSEIDNAIKDGKNVLKEIEVNGAMNFKKILPSAVLIFIKADLDEIKSRLIHRGQNTNEEIEERLTICKNELEYEKEYDYCVMNPEGHPEKAVEDVEKIIRNKKNPNIPS